MPATVVVEETFEVCVTLSRKDIEAGEGMVHAFAKVAVEAERPVSVQVVGKSNAEVIGTDPDILGLPLGGGESSVPLTVRALSTGPVVVHAIVRQGGCRSRPSPEAKAVSGQPSVHRPRPPAPRSTGSTRPSSTACRLDIIESAQPDGSVIYKYAVRVEQDAGWSPFSPCPSSTVRAPWRHSSTRSSRSAPT